MQTAPASLLQKPAAPARPLVEGSPASLPSALPNPAPVDSGAPDQAVVDQEIGEALDLHRHLVDSLPSDSALAKVGLLLADSLTGLPTAEQALMMPVLGDYAVRVSSLLQPPIGQPLGALVEYVQSLDPTRQDLLLQSIQTQSKAQQTAVAGSLTADSQIGGVLLQGYPVILGLLKESSRGIAQQSLVTLFDLSKDLYDQGLTDLSSLLSSLATSSYESYARSSSQAMATHGALSGAAKRRGDMESRLSQLLTQGQVVEAAIRNSRSGGALSQSEIIAQGEALAVAQIEKNLRPLLAKLDAYFTNKFSRKAKASAQHADTAPGPLVGDFPDVASTTA